MRHYGSIFAVSIGIISAAAATAAIAQTVPTATGQIDLIINDSANDGNFATGPIQSLQVAFGKSSTAEPPIRVRHLRTYMGLPKRAQPVALVHRTPRAIWHCSRVQMQLAPTL